MGLISCIGRGVLLFGPFTCYLSQEDNDYNERVLLLSTH